MILRGKNWKVVLEKEEDFYRGTITYNRKYRRAAKLMGTGWKENEVTVYPDGRIFYEWPDWESTCLEEALLKKCFKEGFGITFKARNWKVTAEKHDGLYYSGQINYEGKASLGIGTKFGFKLYSDGRVFYDFSETVPKHLQDSLKFLRYVLLKKCRF